MAKYGKKASASVEREMKAMKQGKLRSGGGKGPKVTNPKQAIAIGLSEARRAGAKMPPPPPGTASAEKVTKKSSAKKAVTKKAAAKKTAGKKTTTKRAAVKKSTAKKSPAKKRSAGS